MSTSDAEKIIYTMARVTKTGSGRWRELCTSVPDGRFGGGGPGGGDVWLANEDGGDDIFDSLELAEGDPAELAVAGCDWGGLPATVKYKCIAGRCVEATDGDPRLDCMTGCH